jgi:hypothetical protein
MPKIVTTITKKPNDPWILITRPEVFTAAEMEDVITPYLYYVRSLPGFMTGLKTNSITDNVFVNEIYFDTEENARNAKELLFGENLDDRIVRKNALMKRKILAKSVTYRVENTIEL